MSEIHVEMSDLHYNLLLMTLIRKITDMESRAVEGDNGFWNSQAAYYREIHDAIRDSGVRTVPTEKAKRAPCCVFRRNEET